MNTLTTTQTLPLTTSIRQRSLTLAASLLITLTVLAGNLQIARGYADGGWTRTDTASASQLARG